MSYKASYVDRSCQIVFTFKDTVKHGDNHIRIQGLGSIRGYATKHNAQWHTPHRFETKTSSRYLIGFMRHVNRWSGGRMAG